MVVFGTFKKFINNQDGTRRLVFNKLSDEKGDGFLGEVFIDDMMVISRMKLKFGHRYLIRGSEIKDGVLTGISQTIKVNKNPKCDIFRRFKGDFHIIAGKYAEKKISDLNKLEISNYCIWLASNSYNEMTIKNSLLILKGIYDKTNK